MEKKMFRVSFTVLTIDGDRSATTRWYESIEEIPAHHFKQDNACLVEKTVIDSPMPSFEEFQKMIGK